MQNPYRVTPPLMSEDTAFSTTESAPAPQPSLSAPQEASAQAETEAMQGTVKAKIESHVEMEPIQKASKAPAQAAQQSASKSKTKKSATAFRTISEVANELDVQQHVLRFWETKFTQVKPLKRGGGRRYYRPEDVALLKRIHHLLYTEGYTIKGVQKLLKGRGKSEIAASVANNENEAQAVAPAPQPKVPASQGVSQEQGAQVSGMSAKQRAVLEMMLAELKALRGMIKA